MTKRTKVVEYDSCDFCGDIEPARGQCGICDKYYCKVHGELYPWADQGYEFCYDHYQLVSGIVKNTGIPMGFIERKLRGEEFSSYVKQQWDERGYEKIWRDCVEVRQ